MISVAEARQLITQHNTHSNVAERPLTECAGYVLAETVSSATDSPPFHQSAMDGYAFAFDSLRKSHTFEITGAVPAGSKHNGKAAPGKAFRIFTGAPLPDGTDTVVMQERTVVKGTRITVMDEAIKPGQNVRLRGSQTAMGEIALKKGQLLSPPAISFLAGLGIANAKVYERPQVRIIVTGSELVSPGKSLHQGQIFESNSYGLAAALNMLGIQPKSTVRVQDDPEELEKAIEEGLNTDILLITGGVSVGDYDYVAAGLEKKGVQTVFHKVLQKPGKPFYFGVKDRVLVFGLPGNPASVMTCFYEYVWNAIRHFSKHEPATTIMLPLAEEFRKKPGLSHFLKGKMGARHVQILPGQESYLMNSFALADCLIEIGEEKSYCKKGEMVKVLPVLCGLYSGLPFL